MKNKHTNYKKADGLDMKNIAEEDRYCETKNGRYTIIKRFVKLETSDGVLYESDNNDLPIDQWSKCKECEK